MADVNSLTNGRRAYNAVACSRPLEQLLDEVVRRPLKVWMLVRGLTPSRPECCSLMYRHTHGYGVRTDVRWGRIVVVCAVIDGMREHDEAAGLPFKTSAERMTDL